MATKEAVKPNFMLQGVNFIREAYAELKKVHHPTRQETIQATIVVLIMITIFAVFLGLIDMGIGALMKSLISAS